MGDIYKNEYCGYFRSNFSMLRYLLIPLQSRVKKWTHMNPWSQWDFQLLARPNSSLWTDWVKLAKSDSVHRSLKILATYHSCTFDCRRIFLGPCLCVPNSHSVPAVQMLAAVCKKRVTDWSWNVCRPPVFPVIFLQTAVIFLLFLHTQPHIHTNSNICFAFRLNTPWNVR